MRDDFEYRGYNVSANGANFVARSIDGDELSLVSSDIERLTAAIDQLWDGLEEWQLPAWCVGATIDLDEPLIAEHFVENVETAPLIKYRRTGQIMLALAVLAIAAPAAEIMRCQLSECEPEIVFTLAVSAVAMIGMLPALVLSVFSALVFNYSVMPPQSAFTIPTREEIVYFLINILVSIGIPLLLALVVEERKERVRTPNT